MAKLLLLGAILFMAWSGGFAMTAVEGKIVKLDRTAKTVLVKGADGTEHTFHFAARTVVHGTEKAGVAAHDSFHGLKESGDVVVHYTAKGGEETAEEVDRLGEGGLQASQGTVLRLDRGARTVTVKAADGGEETYRLSKNAAEDAGKDVSAGAEKSEKVTIYYTEQAGHKVAHFFSKTL